MSMGALAKKMQADIYSGFLGKFRPPKEALPVLGDILFLASKSDGRLQLGSRLGITCMKPPAKVAEWQLEGFWVHEE